MFLDVYRAWEGEAAHVLLPGWSCANCRIVSKTNNLY